MNENPYDNPISVFIVQHWNILTLIAGVIVLLGAVCNWNWLCDPHGAPYGILGRNFRRFIFFILGAGLIAVGIFSMVI